MQVEYVILEVGLGGLFDSTNIIKKPLIEVITTIDFDHTERLGNTLEEHTINNIKEAGFEVLTPTCRSWQIEKPLITGREDIRIKDENGELLPVEIKGISPFEFEKLNTIDDFLKSKKAYIKGYPAQLQIYMLHFGKEKGFFALTNKLTGETKLLKWPLTMIMQKVCCRKQSEFIRH